MTEVGRIPEGEKNISTNVEVTFQFQGRFARNWLFLHDCEGGMNVAMYPAGKANGMHIQYRIRCEFPEQRLGEELMVFDHEADKVHVLNATSAVVWDCLRRGGDLEEAAGDLRAAYRAGEGQDVLSMAHTAIEQLNERGLLAVQT